MVTQLFGHLNGISKLLNWVIAVAVEFRISMLKKVGKPDFFLLDIC